MTGSAPMIIPDETKPKSKATGDGESVGPSRRPRIWYDRSVGGWSIHGDRDMCEEMS
jgi:hypothetical protein